jgi:hypothetical protein
MPAEGFGGTSIGLSLIDIHEIADTALTIIQRCSVKPRTNGDPGRTSMAVLQIQRPKRSVYERGVVACRKCAAPIPVYKLKALPDEFSVRCPRCGERGIYLKRAIAIETLPERRKKPRR